MHRTRRQNENGSGHAGEKAAVQALRGALAGMDRARLDPARRVALLDEAASAVRRPFPGLLSWGLAAAAAVLLLAVAPLLFQGEPASGPQAEPVLPVSLGEARDFQDLQVLQVDGQVELRWDAQPGRQVRVLRGTDPRLAGAQDEVIEGNRWTDRHGNGSRIVYYRVEELEG